MKSVKLEKLLALSDSGTWGEIDATASPVLRSSNIVDYRMDYEDLQRCAIPNKDISRKQLLNRDIIVTKSSGSPEHIGKCAIFEQPNGNQKYYFSNFMLRLRANESLVDAKWLYYYLISDVGRNALKAMNETTTGLRNLSIKSYLAQDIPYATLAEQKNAIIILDRADQLRRKRQQAITLAEQFLKSVFLEMFGNPLTNPKGWKVGKLGDCAEVVTGNTPSTDKEEYYGEDVLWVRPSELGDLLPIQNTEKKLSPLGVEVARILPAGSILVCCIGATLGKIGITSQRCAFNQQINGIYFSEQILPSYGYVLLSFFSEVFISFATQTTLPILNKRNFEQIQIPVADIRTQKKFDAVYNRVLSYITTQQTALTQTESLFNALMQRAFNGTLFSPESRELLETSAPVAAVQPAPPKAIPKATPAPIAPKVSTPTPVIVSAPSVDSVPAIQTEASSQPASETETVIPPISPTKAAHKAAQMGIFDQTSSDNTPKPSPAQALETLRKLLEEKKQLNSFEAQRCTGWDGATIRTSLQKLIAQGLVETTGEKRGLVYHWKTAKAAEA